MKAPILIALAASLMFAPAQAQPVAEPERETEAETETEPETEPETETETEEPMEEIVVEGEQTRAVGEERYWTVLPDPGGRNRMSVIVGVDERRDPILARQIEEFGPPPLVLEGAIARICMSARRPAIGCCEPAPARSRHGQMASRKNHEAAPHAARSGKRVRLGPIRLHRKTA